MEEILKKLEKLAKDVPAVRTTTHYINLLTEIQNNLVDKKYEDVNYTSESLSYSVDGVCSLIGETTLLINDKIKKVYKELDAFEKKLESVPGAEYDEEKVSETNYNYYKTLMQKAYLVVIGEAQKFLETADVYVEMKNNGEAQFNNPYTKELKEWKNSLKSYPDYLDVATRYSEDEDIDDDTLSIEELNDLFDMLIEMFNIIENRQAVIIQYDFTISDDFNNYIKSRLHLISEYSYFFENLEKVQESLADLLENFEKYKTIEGDYDEENYLNQDFYDEFEKTLIPLFESIKDVYLSIIPGEIEPEGKGCKKLK